MGGRVESGMTALEIATRPDFGCRPANRTRPHLLRSAAVDSAPPPKKEAEEEGVANAQTISEAKAPEAQGGRCARHTEGARVRCNSLEIGRRSVRPDCRRCSTTRVAWGLLRLPRHEVNY